MTVFQQAGEGGAGDHQSLTERNPVSEERANSIAGCVSGIRYTAQLCLVMLLE